MSEIKFNARGKQHSYNNFDHFITATTFPMAEYISDITITDSPTASATAQILQGKEVAKTAGMYKFSFEPKAGGKVRLQISNPRLVVFGKNRYYEVTTSQAKRICATLEAPKDQLVRVLSNGKKHIRADRCRLVA